MRRHFLIAFISLMTVMLLAHDIPLARYVRSVERDRLIASLERDAFVIAGASEDLLSDGEGADADLLRRTVELYHQRDGAHVVVVDTAAIAIAVSDDQGSIGEDYSNRPEIVAAIAGEPVAGDRYSATLGGDLVYVSVPVRSGADIVGAVRITFDASVIAQRSNDTIRGIAVVALISLVGAALTALFLASSVTRPLVRLQRTTERVASGDLTTRADTTEGPPEVRQLATSFNTMTERVSNLLEQQRSFAGDASHQLRTPLTALRLQLEMASDAFDHDPASARDRVEAAAAETERLQRIVDGLLMLARAERTTGATEMIDVSAAVTERLAVWEPLAAESGITLVASGMPRGPLAARSVPTGFAQMLDNLLDNAIAISPAGSTVEVTITVAGQTASQTPDRAAAQMVGRAVDETADTDGGLAAHGASSSTFAGSATTGLVEVHVLDRGPGMTPEQIAHATDRFWRAPDAAHQGTGLGLAIVDRLATASGGRLVLSPRPGGGLDAALHLPGG